MVFLICAGLFLITFVMGLIFLLMSEKGSFEDSIEDFNIESIGILIMVMSVLCFLPLVIVGIIEII